MKPVKILIVLASLLVMQLIISCCDCLDTEYAIYTNHHLEINNLDNSGREAVIATGPVHKEAFGIRMLLTREKTACAKSTSSFFFSSAYALSCDCPPELQVTPKDTINLIQIFTIDDFDGTHPSNTEVTEYFKVFKNNSYLPIPDYRNQLPQTLGSYSELEVNADLLLMTAPSLNTIHSFQVRITLSDGRVLEEITTPIQLF